jgi:hypothetical protein
MHHYDRCWRSRSERAAGKIPSLGVSRCNPCQTCCPERGGGGGEGGMERKSEWP